jgi:Domain of unknown function (DUF4129)
VLLAGALVVLLAVVAFASRSGFGHTGHAKPNGTYVSYAFSVFLILFVLMIPVTMWSMIMRARENGIPERRSPLRQFLRSVASIAIFGLVTYVIYRSHIHFHTPKRPHTGATGHGHAHGKRSGGGAEETSPQFQWTVLWVALGLGAVGLVSLVVMYRRWQQRTITPGPTVAQELATALTDAIDDLEAEPDPRRAVIAAYARMERELGRIGLARSPSETAIEYLRRVLLDLSTSGDAVERLTELFEQAKFSHHEVTPEMKREAVDALREIREGIA